MSGGRTPEGEELEPVAIETEEPGEPRWWAVATSLVFAVLFAYQLLRAIGNMVQTTQVYEAFGRAEATPWLWMSLWVALPVLGFAGALLVARGRPVFDRAIVLTASLATVCALGVALVFAASTIG
ncbi:hypothetical protein [Homoserinibacter sp. YIM 151385]|uniref:hypothetical protein n=1 Tax=Homoserinibacter sp. YIM 151385 TaxID=2985506 RepID=UPI0022EFDCEA|nr:hypothetical protein [Homoserinibacter sp. YIM 151385]WBU39278.1 hypothetical protein OF852_06800 [Homoserinibacter sp. YIM 151385]